MYMVNGVNGVSEVNEISDAIKSYTNNLINFRPEFLKMIHDSYLQFNLEELENATSNNEKVLVHQNWNKNLVKKPTIIGFFTSAEQFEKGYEYDNWNDLMGVIVSKNSKVEKEQPKAQLDFKQVNFMKPEEIPKKPEKRMSLNGNNNSGLTFKFKSHKDNSIDNIISFSHTANIKKEKISNFVKEILVNSGNKDTIKLIDGHKDNKIIFVDRILTHINKLGDLSVKGPLDMKSLEKRAEILVSSRLSFIEKVARTVFKFLISLKKLYKTKKEKDKARGLPANSSMRSLLTNQKTYSNLVRKMSNSSSANNIIKEILNEKLKKIREIISSKCIKTLLMSNNKNDRSKMKGTVDIKKFKKLLNAKTENKEKEKKNEKLNGLRKKVKDLLEKDRYDEGNNYIENDYMERNSNVNNANLFYKNEEIQQGKDVKKRKSLHKTEVFDFVNEFMEEKMIMPKKKVNFGGLKMFIKEELNKMNKK